MSEHVSGNDGDIVLLVLDLYLVTNMVCSCVAIETTCGGAAGEGVYTCCYSVCFHGIIYEIIGAGYGIIGLTLQLYTPGYSI